MLDIRLIRRDPDGVVAALSRRGPQAAETIREVLELDERWRGLTTQLEQLRAEQNQASKALRGAPDEAQRAQLAELAARGRALSDEESAVRAQRDAALAALPNLPQSEAPDEDTVLREVGERTPRAAIISSWPASGSTWSAAPGCRARALPTCAASW